MSGYAWGVRGRGGGRATRGGRLRETGTRQPTEYEHDPVRLARRVRPIAACLLIGALAACGGTPQRATTQAPSVSNDWPRPASYDPPGPSHDPWGP
jgi:hypothetical protein